VTIRTIVFGSADTVEVRISMSTFPESSGGSKTLSFAPEELDLRRLIQVLRRRFIWILGAVVIMVGALFAKAISQTPLYTATSELLLQSKVTEAVNSGLQNQNNANSYYATRTIATERRVIESNAVSALATKRLGFRGAITAAGVADADILRVTATDTNQAKAALIANVFAEEYISYRRAGSVDDLLSAADSLDDQVVQLEQQLASLERKVAVLKPEEVATRQTLELTRAANVNQLTVLRNRSEALRLDASLRTGGARIINRADIPTSPTSPKPIRSLILGILLGLVLGTGLAFAIDLLDDRIRSKEDFDAMQLGMPVLGLIPQTRSFKRSEVPDLESFRSPNSPVAEAYRTLRSAVQFAGIESDLKVLLITSTDAAESKSTTAANLAVTLARSGTRVCIVDADLRNPRLHMFFGVRQKEGLTDVLLGSERPPDVIVSFEEIEDLGMLPAGNKAANPAELLGSNRMAVLIGALKKRFDLVIIDSPPVLPVVDSLELARQVDAVLVATLIGRTKRRGLKHAVELLNNVDAPLLGVVMTGVDKATSYGYGYGYGYGEEQPKGRRAKVRNAMPQSQPGLTVKPPSQTTEPIQFVQSTIRSRIGDQESPNEPNTVDTLNGEVVQTNSAEAFTPKSN
jgi:polysaccharide biosynthesis transport protein